MARIKVNINPLVLKWAREEAGYSIEEIAEKLSIDTSRYLEWEEKGEGIPLGKLKKIANYFKRQIAFFFLTEVPQKTKKPRDYRNLSNIESTLSKKVLLAIRRSVHLQNLARELEGRDYWVKKIKRWEGLKRLKNKNEIIGNLRTLIGIDINQQLKWRSESEAYSKWRLAIEEKLGILIFQFSMPMEELQGFCFTDDLPYIIVTNSNHSLTGRIFTLFHELAHVIKNQSGMCLVDKVERNQKVEWSCNTFAGNFLVPSDLLAPINDIKDIARYSRKLKVSREVYLRRLKEERLISDDDFFNMLNDIRATYREFKSKVTRFVPPEVKSKASRGETFYNIIINALNNNKINYTDAAHALDLKIYRLLNELK